MVDKEYGDTVAG